MECDMEDEPYPTSQDIAPLNPHYPEDAFEGYHYVVDLFHRTHPLVPLEGQDRKPWTPISVCKHRSEAVVQFVSKKGRVMKITVIPSMCPYLTYIAPHKSSRLPSHFFLRALLLYYDIPLLLASCKECAYWRYNPRQSVWEKRQSFEDSPLPTLFYSRSTANWELL